MFPNNEIQAFYQNFRKVPFDNEELVAIAQLCEEWIFTLPPMPEFIASTIGSINTPGAGASIYPLYWAFGMALCIPSAKTGDLFRERHDFLASNSMVISECVDDISDAIRKDGGHRVDLLTAFSHLPDREYFATAYECYSTDVSDVQQDALAWDNLPVFLGTLPKHAWKAREKAFTLMAKFHDPQGTTIYQHFVKTPMDERDLFRAQITNLLQSVMGDYDGYMRMINRGPRKVTLMPNTSAKPAYAKPDRDAELFRRADFAEKVRLDTNYVVKEFFHIKDGILRKPQNATVVHAITRAFVEAGISSETLVRLGVLGNKMNEPDMGLGSLISTYAYLGPSNQDFYREVFRLHLKDFTLEQIIAASRQEKTLEAAYQLTGKPELLATCSPQTREKCFGNDLGL